jgi:hypothetical protein
MMVKSRHSSVVDLPGQSWISFVHPLIHFIGTVVQEKELPWFAFTFELEFSISNP